MRMLGKGGAGDPSLAATSPAKRAANVRAPVLLIHETTTPHRAQSVRNVVLQGEDHYLSKSATRTQMLETLDAFHARSLPANP